MRVAHDSIMRIVSSKRNWDGADGTAGLEVAHDSIVGIVSSKRNWRGLGADGARSFRMLDTNCRYAELGGARAAAFVAAGAAGRWSPTIRW